jgi:hypothetical protein
MGDDFIVGPFGRLLPRPNTSSARKVPFSDINHYGPSDISDNMAPKGHFSKDVPINNDLPRPGQQLPPVSHILNGRGYHDFPPIERPASPHGHGNFQRSRHSRGGSGGIAHGIFSTHGLYSQPQSAQTNYCNRNDLPLPTSYSLSPPDPDQTAHNTATSSLPSVSDGPLRSGLDTSHIRSQSSHVPCEEGMSSKGVRSRYNDAVHHARGVDTDSVNPYWGVTKAGKPRKRLAQACATCREKKIRCDPGSGFSKCSQCLKFNRECGFEQKHLLVCLSRSCILLMFLQVAPKSEISKRLNSELASTRSSPKRVSNSPSRIGNLYRKVIPHRIQL